MKKSFKLLSAAFIALASLISAQAAEVTLFDGTATTDGAPIYGYNYDSEDYITQTIYPEVELTALQGKSITSMKFYIANEDGNPLNGGKLAISVGMTTQTSFPSWSPSAIEGLTHVADITMTAGETEVIINFNDPFVYEGSNLVIEAKVVESGNWDYLYFYGQDADVYNVLHKRYSTSTEAFYPKVTFIYEGDTPEPEVLRGDVNNDESVNIADVTALIDMLLSGAEMIPEADCNLDNAMNIADVTALIDFLLSGQWPN